MKIKKIFLLSLLVLLLVGVSYATEANNDTLTTTDTPEVVKETTSATNIVDNNINEEIKTDKEITKQKIENKTISKTVTEINKSTPDKKSISNENNVKKLKTDANTYTTTVSSYDELVNEVANARFGSYTNYTINLEKRNYVATDSIEWRSRPNDILIINGNGATIDGKNNCKFIEITENPTLILKNIILKNFNNKYGSGGAIDCYNSSLKIINTTFNNNHAESGGGAIWIYKGNLTITDSEFNNNKVEFDGGAISIDCLKNVVIKNSKFTNNTAEYYGGAISNFGNDILIENNIFIKNACDDLGAAIYSPSGTTEGIVGREWIPGHNKTEQILVYDYISGQMVGSHYENNTYWVEGHYEDKIGIVSLGNNVKINNNIFERNIVNEMGGEAIDNQGTNTKISGNVNERSIYSSTIYVGGTNNSITNNTFNDGKRTILTVGSTDTVTVGTPMSIYGKLTDNDGKNLAYQKLTVIIDDKTYTVNTTKYGNYNFKITPTTLGTKTITATYPRSDIYVNSSATSTFAVKQNTIITVGSTTTATLGNQMSIYGKLTDKNGKNLANQQVKITIDKKTYTTNTTQYGNYNIKITPNSTGTKTILATYTGSNVYMNSTATSTFIVKQGTIITVGSSKTVPVGSQMSIYGKLTDKEGNNLAYKQIKINVDDKTYTVNTTKYGNFNFKITPTTTGTKTILATYTGSDVYMNSSTSSTFVVKESTIITVGSSKVVNVGKQMSIYGKLTDKDGKNLANQQIKITVDGKTYTTNTTQYGNYNIKITPTTAGTKTITATYPGTDLYMNSTATSTFTAKQSTIITVGSKKTVPVGKQMSIYGKLTDKDGKNLANQQIKITVDGKTITTNTTQYGNYNIKITPTTTGTKTITATYDGNNANLASTNSTTFQVKASS